MTLPELSNSGEALAVEEGVREEDSVGVDVRVEEADAVSEGVSICEEVGVVVGGGVLLALGVPDPVAEGVAMKAGASMAKLYATSAPLRQPSCTRREASAKAPTGLPAPAITPRRMFWMRGMESWRPGQARDRAPSTYSDSRKGTVAAAPE